jgi:chromosome segregation ATPase
MMSRSPHEPVSIATNTLRQRLSWGIRRRLEPLAMRLLDWCRFLEVRVEDGERRAQDTLTEVRAIEGRVHSLEGQVQSLEERAVESYWGREALVERINELTSTNEGVAARLMALEEKAEKAYWAREAVVESLNQAVANQSTANLRIESLQRQIDEYVPVPIAFGLDALAMGRRLAAIEDHVERLLVEGDTTGDDRATPTLVHFSPRDQVDLATEGGKAAG